MTKLRAPLSFEDAITRVAGVLGWAEACKAIGKEDRTLRAYSDPDDPRQLGVGDALILDAAYQRAGGDGAPIYEAYALQLEVSASALSACTQELARRAAVAAKEGGQAVSSLIAATLPGATPADRALAIREVREARDALRDTLPMLEAAPAPADTS